MLSNLVSKAWLIVFAYTGFIIWEMYIAHNEKMVELELQVPLVKKQLKKREAEKKQIEQYLVDIEKARTEIELVAQKVESVQRQLPDVIDDAANLRAICSICNEGASNLTLERPSSLKLLSQVRRAKGGDQLELLKWLIKKFPNQTKDFLHGGQD